MIRLDRSVLGRLLGGARLQGLLALFAVLLALRAVLQATDVVNDNSLPIGATLLVLLALVVALAIGAAGYAEANDAGLRWRYYLSHSYSWDEVERVDLEVRGIGITAVRHLVVVQVRGRRLKVTPAAQAGAGRVRFGRELLALAGSHGVPVKDSWG